MKEYTLILPHGETTVQLSDEDAEAYGDAVKPLGSKSKRPANKAAAPENKAAQNVSDKQAAAAAQAFGANAQS